MRNIFENYRVLNNKKWDWTYVIYKKLLEILIRRNSKYVLSSGIPQFFIISQDHISNRVVLNGIYERDYLDSAMEFLEKNGKINGCAVDAGANIGNHSLYIANFFESVFSFEPNPRIFPVLNANSKLMNNITAYEVGLSDENSKTRINIINNYNLGESTAKEDSNIKIQSSHEIKLVRLDEIQEIQKSEIGLIKIDVENFELKVMNGATQLIREKSPIIFFEQHKSCFPENGSDSECVNFLKIQGYNYFYEVDIFPRIQFIEIRHIRNIIQHISRILFGYSYKVGKIEKFKRRFYSFIIASKAELNT